MKTPLKTPSLLKRAVTIGGVWWGMPIVMKAWTLLFALIIVAGAILGSLYYLSVNTGPVSDDQTQQLVDKYGPVGGSVAYAGNMAVFGLEIGIQGLPMPMGVGTSNSTAIAVDSVASNTNVIAADVQTVPAGITVGPVGTYDPSTGTYYVNYGAVYDAAMNVVPWIGSPPASTNGAIAQSTNVGVSCTALSSNTNSVSLVVAMQGLIWCFVGSDMADGIWTNYWLQSPTVVIQWTKNYVIWTPLFTNTVTLNTTNTFSDTNAPMRRWRLYRAMH